MKFYLTHDTARQNALEAVKSAPDGYQVDIKPRSRSTAQNSRLWALLHDISSQVSWHGKKLSEEDWKTIFTAGLRKQTAVPNLENNGFVVLGNSTSKMTVDEMVQLQELMEAFAVEHDVQLKEI